MQAAAPAQAGQRLCHLPPAGDHHRLQIVVQLPPRQALRPACREGVYTTVEGLPGQPCIEAAIDLGRRDSHSGQRQQQPELAEIRKLVHLLASTCPERQPAVEKERDVAAERGRDLPKAPLVQAQPPQTVEQHQHRGGIRRATAQPAADRNTLAKPQMRPGPDTGCLPQAPRRLQDQVVVVGADCPRGLDLELEDAVGRRLRRNLIKEINALQQRPELVEAVRTPAQHLEVEVDLGRHPDPQLRHGQSFARCRVEGKVAGSP